MGSAYKNINIYRPKTYDYVYTRQPTDKGLLNEPDRCMHANLWIDRAGRGKMAKIGRHVMQVRMLV